MTTGQIYHDFITWLTENLNEPCAMALRADIDGSVLDLWLDDVDPFGHIEIPARHSRTGNPVTGSFPQLVELLEY